MGCQKWKPRDEISEVANFETTDDSGCEILWHFESFWRTRSQSEIIRDLYLLRPRLIDRAWERLWCVSPKDNGRTQTSAREKHILLLQKQCAFFPREP